MLNRSQVKDDFVSNAARLGSPRGDLTSTSRDREAFLRARTGCAIRKKGKAGRGHYS
jgi:hypothetical protein